jgi:hypothetical protein
MKSSTTRNSLSSSDHASLAEVVTEGHLKPHGGRRGLGSDLYAWNTEFAQEFLRHESIAYTHGSSSVTLTSSSSDCQRYSRLS